MYLSGQAPVMGTDEQAQTSKSEQAGGSHAPGSEITVEMLRELLASEAADARLVLEAGRVRITSDSGGLVLISREELLDRVGTDPNATELTEQAGLLNTEVRLRGA
ncbi:hypothetical protein ACGFQG_30020 [Nocardia fluminea]|uniref:hypothetical protein n=1 Tax=Nocardia fluminea TaxID=134984 RepID=UPI0033E62398